MMSAGFNGLFIHSWLQVPKFNHGMQFFCQEDKNYGGIREIGWLENAVAYNLAGSSRTSVWL